MRNASKVFGAGLLSVGLVCSASFADFSIRLASQTQTGGYEESAFRGSTVFVSPNVAIGAADIMSGRVGANNVELTLSSHGASAAATLLRANAGQRLAIYQDRAIVAAPLVDVNSLKGSTLTVSAAALPPIGPTLTIVPSKTSVNPGDLVSFDVFINAVQDLRGYQIALDVSGKAGALQIADIAVDKTRADFVFGSEQVVDAGDTNGIRLVAALFAGSTSVTGQKYLGTFTYQTSKSTQGQFTATLRMNEDSALRDSNSLPIGFQAAGPATINVGVSK
jgi:hypothetical protein